MSLLRTRPITTPAMLAVWDDTAIIGHALAFEAALARAQAADMIIPQAAANAIGAACDSIVIDAATLADEAALAGTLAIPLIAQLRAVLDPNTAVLVHRGATSQDVADTVTMRQVRAAAALVLADGDRVAAGLATLARRHAVTVAIGRTLLQDAVPIAFGLRIAQWRAGIVAAAQDVRKSVDRHAAIQLGGAAGTRAGHDGKGADVARRMAAELGLAFAEPWHAQRTGVAAIGASVGILIGATAKMARDISLLSQNTVGEAREPAVAGRGGSSAMANKRNPTGCQIALSAATRAPGLVATLLAALPAEEERGPGGWQAEGPVMADLFLLASGALQAMAVIAAGLEIDEAAIERNLDAARLGDDLGDDIGESRTIIDALLATGD